MDTRYQFGLLLLCRILQYAHVEGSPDRAELDEPLANIAEVKMILQVLDRIYGQNDAASANSRPDPEANRSEMRRSLQDSLPNVFAANARPKPATVKRGFWFSKNPKRICQGDIFC